MMEVLSAELASGLELISSGIQTWRQGKGDRWDINRWIIV